LNPQEHKTNVECKKIINETNGEQLTHPNPRVRQGRGSAVSLKGDTLVFACVRVIGYPSQRLPAAATRATSSRVVQNFELFREGLSRDQVTKPNFDFGFSQDNPTMSKVRFPLAWTFAP
jgi:hypothetical protein